MTFLGHLAQIAVPTIFDEYQFGAGNFFGQNLSRLDVAAGAALVDVFVPDDDQGRRFDFMY